ncbi:purine phosphoribosyltransferase family protein Apf [Andrena cerasifolii]|uniref:purine phosphoribosyltransferase family protein Apf n=1 Tax=Andrena cerasifolii TaxID=2819439 RepID=UPI00403783B0
MGKRAAGFVVFRRMQGMIEYLLMQTSYGDHHWTPPKGHVDPGESDLDTAVRETKEESGLLLSDLKVYDDVKRELTYEVTGKPKTVVYWLAELLNSDKSVEMSEEHQAYQWLSIEDACSVVKYSDMQSMLRNLNEYIHQNLS